MTVEAAVGMAAEVEVQVNRKRIHHRRHHRRPVAIARRTNTNRAAAEAAAIIDLIQLNRRANLLRRPRRQSITEMRIENRHRVILRRRRRQYRRQP